MNVKESPSHLPVPQDDGVADHLEGFEIPEITLTAKNSATVYLGRQGFITVIYVYPMTGRPDTPLPDAWVEIPGARGCTPQSCTFRDHYAELLALNTDVYGLSTQSTAYQK